MAETNPTKVNERPLNQRERDFCLAYFLDRKVTKAAIKAGYSEKTAASIGSENLTKPKIQAYLEELRSAAKQSAITEMAYRLARLNELESLLWDVIEARKAEYAESNVVGGGTGLVVKQVKMIGTGPSAEMVEEFAVDISVIKEIQNLHAQTAKELGQWTEKHEHSGSITREFVIVSNAADGDAA